MTCTMKYPGPLKWSSSDHQIPPGTQPFPTQQRNFETCTSHSLAKCIMAWLDKPVPLFGCDEAQIHNGYDAEFENILNRLLAVLGEDMLGQNGPIPTAHFVFDFHNQIVKFQVEDKHSHEAKQMSVRIEVQSTRTNGDHWEERQNQEVSFPNPYTAIGIVENPQTGNKPHAVFISSYNTQTRKVEIINSWGDEKKLGPLIDCDFYEVDLIKLSKI